MLRPCLNQSQPSRNVGEFVPACEVRTTSKCREIKTHPTRYSRAQWQSAFHLSNTRNGKSNLSGRSLIACDSVRPKTAATDYPCPLHRPHIQLTCHPVQTTASKSFASQRQRMSSCRRR